MYSRRCQRICVCICLLIFLHIAWEAVHNPSRSFREQERGGGVWFEDTHAITELLRKQLETSEIVHKNFTNLSSIFLHDIAKRRRNARLATVNCKAMFEGSTEEIRRAKETLATSAKETNSEADYIRMTSDCESFVKNRGYLTQPLSKEEYDFPIAFSILIYKDVEQVERLLRAIYTPQNYYCLHVDLKASDAIHLAVRSITQCFPNVFVASRLERVFWGHISIFRADMNCLRDLLKYQWKYFINLTGQMFPLQSNRDLVKILTMYNGANDIEGTYKR